VDMIIDAGSTDIGLESTVVKVEKDLVLILRPGAITKEMIEGAVYPSIVLFASDADDLRASPGTRYKHYAPKAKLEILSSSEELEKRKVELEKENKKVGTMIYHSVEEASKNLYRDLRQCDKEGIDVILVESFPEAGLGVALMDRLRKAANS
jgi:L-threonylcarbamoyladenylate synthase